MNKFLVIASSALLATGMAFAQDVNSSGQSGASSNQQGVTGESNSVRGCLSGSADNYNLTDSNGTIYHLQGANTQLGAALGAELERTEGGRAALDRLLRGA